MSKLTEAQRVEIARAYYADGVSQVDLARKYRVGRTAICKIVKERRPTRRLPWPPEFPGTETPEWLLTARGSFPPDDVLARAREEMRRDWPVDVELRDRREEA